MYGSPQSGGQWNPNGPPSATSQPGQQTPQQQHQQQQPPPPAPQQQGQQQQQQQQQQHQQQPPPSQQQQGQQQQTPQPPNQQQGQPPTPLGSQWSPQPPNGQYTPRQNQIPSLTSQSLPLPPASAPVPAMHQALQPQHPGDPYRLPPPTQMPGYPPPYQQQAQMPYAASQPAPRQRTAIACRYCRRRKIRCSGFEQSEEGRCTNCVRFSQECVFTPVSAQTQAFVPAHTVWRGQNPPPNTQLYGAYGQPLPHNSRDPYPQQPPQPGQYPPAPQNYQGQPVYQQAPGPGGQPMPLQPGEGGRKRGNDEPHTPTLPPPNPGPQANMSSRASNDGQYSYGDPSDFSADKDDDNRKFDSTGLSKGFEPRREFKDVSVQTEPIPELKPLFQKP